MHTRGPKYMHLNVTITRNSGKNIEYNYHNQMWNQSMNHSLINIFSNSISIYAFIHSLVNHFINSCALINSFVRLFNGIASFNHFVIRRTILILFHLLQHLFIQGYLFIHWVFYPSIDTFIYSSIHPFIDLPVLYSSGTEIWNYVDVRPGAHMFYWLYHTYHPDGYLNRPLILWLQVLTIQL